MSGKSSLRRYLQMVQTQREQIREAMRYIEEEVKGERVEPPETNSDVLHTLFKKALAEAIRGGNTLFKLVRPKLYRLQKRHDEHLDEARHLWRRRAYYTGRDNPLTLARVAAEVAWRELDKLLLAVEAAQQDGKAPDEAPQKDIEKGEQIDIIFDDEKRVVTINEFAYPVIDDDRAFRLFKLVAEARGEIVSRNTILGSIKGLDGKNKLLNTKKKLPKQLQYCLESIKGREGGYRYRPPKNK
jgi:hypothetical protein